DDVQCPLELVALRPSRLRQFGVAASSPAERGGTLAGDLPGRDAVLHQVVGRRRGQRPLPVVAGAHDDEARGAETVADVKGELAQVTGSHLADVGDYQAAVADLVGGGRQVAGQVGAPFSGDLLQPV